MECEYCGKKLRITCILQSRDFAVVDETLRKVVGRCDDCDADYEWYQRFVLMDESDRRPCAAWVKERE